MNMKNVPCLFAVILTQLVQFFPYSGSQHIPPSVCNNIDEPLILTPFIESGQIQIAKSLSRVQSNVFVNLVSYSAYFTVNKSDNSNMYFWFFPAEIEQPENAPVIVWLQGGPGSSSFFGLLSGNGPYRVDKALTVSLHPERWSKVANMLYFDNPVGTGFSFTISKDGLSRTEDQVAGNLYQALLQFYTMFPEYAQGELYMAGESYAGKYIPSVSYRIHVENLNSPFKLPLKGLIMGNGWVDPVSQFQYGQLLYQLGMISLHQKDVFLAYESQFAQLVATKEWWAASQLSDAVINGGLFPYPTYFYNVTHSKNYNNMLLTEEPEEWNYYIELLKNCDIRRSLRVGNQAFVDTEIGEVAVALYEDVPQSTARLLETLMDSYRVLIYNGILDLSVGQAGTENYLSKLSWKGATEFLNTAHIFWRVNQSDKEIAGYVRQVGDFTQIAVRNSGHVVPYDQPRATLDMIDRFLGGRGFADS